MNVLIVCSGNKGKINAFISEQVDSLRKEGVSTQYFFIHGKGVLGYLSNVRRLHKVTRSGNYHLIHAHYGLSGLLSVLQRKIPVVTTFHGSDIKKSKILRLSRLAAKLSAYNIVVEISFSELLKAERKTSVIPCGVDFENFFETDQRDARRALGFPEDRPIILFTSSFDNPVKNYSLAKQAVDKTTSKPLFIELKNFTRQQVNLLMNAADVLLMTSFSEGSPQVVKEALTCRLPVISTAVGDVPQLAKQTDGITIVPYDAHVIAAALDQRLSDRKRIIQNNLIRSFDNKRIAVQIKKVYSGIINKSV